MEEPMEEGIQEQEIQQQQEENRPPKVSSILRPGSMVMMTITVQDYEEIYWPKLQGAINQLLTMTPGDYIPISYEQMYSCVYKCVCKQFSERLYSDLLNQITTHLQQLSLELQVQEPFAYVEKFNFAMNQYLQALGGIVPIFNYMNRFYIETKLKTDLNIELRKLFVQYVADRHVPVLIPILVDATSKPFAVPPPTMASLIKNLHELKPDFSQLRPHLFAKYLPSILPPCQEADLEKYIEEAKQMSRDLRTDPEFIIGDQSRKRSGDEEVSKSVPVSFLPKTSNTS